MLDQALENTHASTPYQVCGVHCERRTSHLGESGVSKMVFLDISTPVHGMSRYLKSPIAAISLGQANSLSIIYKIKVLRVFVIVDI